MKFYDASIPIMITALIVSAIAAIASYEFLGPTSPVTQGAEKVVEIEAEAIVNKEIPTQPTVGANAL